MAGAAAKGASAGSAAWAGVRVAGRGGMTRAACRAAAPGPVARGRAATGHSCFKKGWPTPSSQKGGTPPDAAAARAAGSERGAARTLRLSRCSRCAPAETSVSARAEKAQPTEASVARSIGSPSNLPLTSS